MFAEDYNLNKAALEKEYRKEVSLTSLQKMCEYEHKMDKPVLEFVSAVLDG